MPIGRSGLRASFRMQFVLCGALRHRPENGIVPTNARPVFLIRRFGVTDLVELGLQRVKQKKGYPQKRNKNKQEIGMRSVSFMHITFL